MVTQQKTYKLRAECFHDVIQLVNKLGKSSDHALGEFRVIPLYIAGHRAADCELEIKSSMSLVEIRDLMMSIPDSHVMIETVELFNSYTGFRENL